MLPALEASVPTAPTVNPCEFDLAHIQHAILQARIGLSEGGIPIGAALVTNGEKGGVVLGVGRNRRVQKGSATLHGEIDCFENIGRLPARTYKECTLYTTLSPCAMCAGAIILYGIPRVVIGENETFIGTTDLRKGVTSRLTCTFEGGEDILRSRGVEIINLNVQECKQLMKKFIEIKSDIWDEDIGQC